MSGSDKAVLNLYGRFSFVASDGRDIAPKSAKSQALLALVATSDGKGRGRLWLQKRLGPRSDPERAAISLRQALSEIRRALEEDRDLLFSDRRSVSLDLSRITIAAAAPGAEFLEGLGLSEAENGLGDWIQRQRQETHEPVAAPVVAPKTALPAKPIIVFKVLSEKGTEQELVEDIFVDCVARSLRETLLVDVHIGNLRRALGDAADEPRFVGTVRGVGYVIDPLPATRQGK